MNGVGYIYCIENKINHKKYIGQTSKSIEERFKSHIKCMKNKRNSVIYDAMSKYGLENFIVYEIEMVENLDDLSIREMYWINYYNSTNRDYGYNMTAGGDKCNKMEAWSEEDKHHLYMQQAENRRKTCLIKYGVDHFAKVPEIRNTWKGNTASWEERYGEEEATRRKKELSNKMKECGHRPPVHHNGNGGHKHSEYSKKKMSISKKGKSYEEVSGEEYGKERREIQRKSTSLRHFKERQQNLEVRLSILNQIGGNFKIKVSELNLYGNTMFFLRQLFKEIDINNYQKFKFNFVGDELDWENYFKNKQKELRIKYEK